MLMNGTEGRVWAEIYLDNLVENYKIIKNEVKNAHIMAAIKADAYGHGAVEVARILENEGITMFGVASVEEGIELRQAGITIPILILSPILYSQIETALQFHLIPTVSEMKFFRALEKKVKNDVAMTGEITLRGKILPVGGIKEKVLAAHRAGIKKVILPNLNKPDLIDVPQEIKDDIKFIYVDTMDEVLYKGIEKLNKITQSQ